MTLEYTTYKADDEFQRRNDDPRKRPASEPERVFDRGGESDNRVTPDVEPGGRNSSDGDIPASKLVPERVIAQGGNKYERTEQNVNRLSANLGKLADLVSEFNTGSVKNIRAYISTVSDHLRSTFHDWESGTQPLMTVSANDHELLPRVLKVNTVQAMQDLIDEDLRIRQEEHHMFELRMKHQKESVERLNRMASMDKFATDVSFSDKHVLQHIQNVCKSLKDEFVSSRGSLLGELMHAQKTVEKDLKHAEDDLKNITSGENKDDQTEFQEAIENFARRENQDKQTDFQEDIHKITKLIEEADRLTRNIKAIEIAFTEEVGVLYETFYSATNEMRGDTDSDSHVEPDSISRTEHALQSDETLFNEVTQKVEDAIDQLMQDPEDYPHTLTLTAELKIAYATTQHAWHTCTSLHDLVQNAFLAQDTENFKRYSLILRRVHDTAEHIFQVFMGQLRSCSQQLHSLPEYVRISVIGRLLTIEIPLYMSETVEKLNSIDQRLPSGVKRNRGVVARLRSLLSHPPLYKAWVRESLAEICTGTCTL